MRLVYLGILRVLLVVVSGCAAHPGASQAPQDQGLTALSQWVEAQAVTASAWLP